MALLLVTAPLPPAPAGGDYGWAVWSSDGRRLRSQGSAPPALLPTSDEVILGVPAAMLSWHTVTLPHADVVMGRRLRAQHEASLVVVEEIRAVADRISTQAPEVAPVRRLLDRLRSELLTHERADEAELVPLVARALGEPATYALTRTHAEIEHQVARLGRLLDDVPDEGAQP